MSKNHKFSTSNDVTSQQVVIHNPTSIQYVVKLRPNQNIFLRLDDSLFPDHNIEFMTPNFLIDAEEQGSNYRIYQISHISTAIKWAEYSSFFLGEIWIDSRKKTSRLIVSLDTENQNKSNFMTVFNPDYYNLHINPGDILEVVLHNRKFDENCKWIWEYRPEINCDLELIGSSNLSLSSWEENLDPSLNDHPQSPYARYPRVDSPIDPKAIQTHFWFRYNKHILSAIESNSGVKQVGDFRFFGYPNKTNLSKPEAEFNMSVHINFDRKNKMKVFNSLLLPKMGETVPPESFFFPNIPKSSFRPNRHVRNVNVQLLDSKCFESGCQSMSALPPNDQEIGWSEFSPWTNWS